jgi:hypothetical protein
MKGEDNNNNNTEGTSKKTRSNESKNKVEEECLPIHIMKAEHG